MVKQLTSLGAFMIKPLAVLSLAMVCFIGMAQAPTKPKNQPVSNGPSLEETEKFIKERMEDWGEIHLNYMFDEAASTSLDSTCKISFDGNFWIVDISQKRRHFDPREPENDQINDEEYIIKIDISTLDITSIRHEDKWDEKTLKGKIMCSKLVIPIKPQSTTTFIRHSNLMGTDHHETIDGTIVVGKVYPAKDGFLIWPHNDRFSEERFKAALQHLFELKGGKPSPF